jgi:integrase
LCNDFLAEAKRRVDAGEMTQRTWNEYQKSAERIIFALGRYTALESLNPSHFTYLRRSLPKWGPTTIGNEIGRMKVIFNFAHKSGMIERMFSYGSVFAKPSSRVMRKHKTASQEKFWEASGILSLLDAADVHMKAFILLGINCAFLPCDCGRLQFTHLDGNWNNYHREKTGNFRKSWMWDETVEAINASIARRPECKEKGLVFLTKYRNPWHRVKQKHSPLSSAFSKTVKAAGLVGKGTSFSALRSTFRTIADVDKDAARYVCGHAAENSSQKIDEVYRSFKRFPEQRFKDLSQHVHNWLYG